MGHQNTSILSQMKDKKNKNAKDMPSLAHFWSYLKCPSFFGKPTCLNIKNTVFTFWTRKTQARLMLTYIFQFEENIFQLLETQQKYFKPDLSLNIAYFYFYHPIIFTFITRCKLPAEIYFLDMFAGCYSSRSRACTSWRNGETVIYLSSLKAEEPKDYMS